MVIVKMVNNNMDTAEQVQTALDEFAQAVNNAEAQQLLREIRTVEHPGRTVYLAVLDPKVVLNAAQPSPGVPSLPSLATVVDEMHRQARRERSEKPTERRIEIQP